MRALWAVYKRETALIFRSPIAYAVTFALMIFLGILFAAILASVALTQAQQQQGFGGGAPSAGVLVTQILSTLVFLMFLIAPLMTMRLLSEENREGTLEVLMTLPMSDWTFVVGKFLAVWTFYTVMLLLTLVHLFILRSLGPVNVGLVSLAYFGAWLYGGAALALTMIWSAITEDQIVAAFLGAATLLGLFLADGIALVISDQVFPGGAEFVRQLGFTTHYDNTMLQGILRAEDVLYFVLVMIVSLFITSIIVGTRRWRA